MKDRLGGQAGERTSSTLMFSLALVSKNCTPYSSASAFPLAKGTARFSSAMSDLFPTRICGQAAGVAGLCGGEGRARAAYLVDSVRGVLLDVPHPVPDVVE